MDSWHNGDTDKLCDALLSLKTREECYAFLEDVCTIKEVQDLSGRLAVAEMLSRGVIYAEICRATGASTATISRVSKCLEYGSGGYKTVLDRLENEGKTK